MKRIINTLLLLSVAMMTMAQTSFVVADKNGNSQLVQSLVFQQQQTADRFSWKSDGSATGDINDLLFIARAQSQLATANSNDVTEMLEQLSGTDLVDAEAIAATVKENPNAEEAYTADGDNLVYHKEGSEYLTIYPMYDLKPAFSESDYEGAKQLLGKQYLKTKKASGTVVSKVAIFNFFEGDNDYDLQNKLVGSIYSLFDKNGYDVTMYQNEEFTVKKLDEVVSESKTNKNYKAIIIMSHGSILYESTFSKEATSVFMTGEECDQYASCDKMFDSKSNKYYKIHTSALTPDKDCILYLGSCYSAYWGEDYYKEEKVKNPYDTSNDFPFKGILPYSEKVQENEYPEKDNLTVIAWAGRNSIAQAHAAILFRRMIYDEQTLYEAAANSFFRDPVNMTAGVFYSKSIYASNKITLNYKYGNQPDYTSNASIRITSMGKDKLIKKEGNSVLDLSGVIEGNNNIHGVFNVVLCQVFDGENRKEFSYENSWPIFITEKDNKKIFSGSIPLKYFKEGLYAIKVYTVTDYKEIKIQNPYYIVYSRNLNENYALPEISDEDVYTPVILGSEGQPLTEIDLTTGSSQTFSLDAYPGHTFETPCLDKSVCTVSLSGTTLTMTGISEGSTYIGIYDVQNRQMTAVKVTVTAGEPFENLCPDEHHPHLIDLGLPCGVKISCCNYGSDNPLLAGSTYTWDEAMSLEYGNNLKLLTEQQIREIVANCTYKKVRRNGVDGQMITGLNGNSVFIPLGTYWSCDVNPDGNAYYMYVHNDVIQWARTSKSEKKYARPSCGNNSDIPAYTSCPDDHHPHLIDLGLPSGTKWACCNVGASKPEDYGLYFAWGETNNSEDRSFNWESYRWGSMWKLTKYCTNSRYGTVDNRTVLDLEDDVSHVNWGGYWVMPNLDQIKELVNNCSYEWSNSKIGGKFTGVNGASIFLPMAGHFESSPGRYYWGGYWSASLDESRSYDASELSFGYDNANWNSAHRSYGQPVRPVIKK